MFQTKSEERDYAFIPNADAPVVNRYGQSIETVPEGHELRGKSLNVNGDKSVGSNPNRYKQHGFYFNADNCIACHACETACAEKNDTPPHLSFRSVGYVEGGSWPDYTRLNISMACNHCDDPVCLKGCPTRAYTKFAEYGAVLQDPDICFGCGYCTWVCPYNAPQLDPVKGRVEKCNMCVDRLEVGLKPACAAACLGGALDFGIIETTPENRHQTLTQIPGFPTPEITHPNIRFQQTRTLPRELTRTDSRAIRYERDEAGDSPYKTKLRDTGAAKGWGLKDLSSREDPLVIFTLITQGVVGAMLALILGPLLSPSLAEGYAQAGTVTQAVLLFALLGLQTFALALSTMHLGKPHRFYRAFNNLKYSPVSREIAGIAVFFNLLGAYTLLASFPMLTAWLPESVANGLVAASGWGAALSGPVALWFMHKIYRIKARPFWNHWQVLTHFYGNALTLGALTVALVFGGVLFAQDAPLAGFLSALAWPVALGIAMEGVGLWFHARDNQKIGEAAASHHEQVTHFAYSYVARNVGLGIALAGALALALSAPQDGAALGAWFVLGAIVLTAAFIGRALFYVLVVPTSMPGGFFWRNPAFQKHARETGLAHLPQTGVVMDGH
ncbi:MAG: dimethyl sulfoxide reductase anchor subunit [Gammaproteobacteria bacterium]|nr:dimethyl sulfoxide reductase anchor subunit [Gammaproteobacteria bacterium]MCP5136790.1 dimethyl sulfoxide reductase anchor subunit [Gammaproteobacteria bacterium]